MIICFEIEINDPGSLGELPVMSYQRRRVFIRDTIEGNRILAIAGMTAARRNRWNRRNRWMYEGVDGIFIHRLHRFSPIAFFSSG